MTASFGNSFLESPKPRRSYDRPDEPCDSRLDLVVSNPTARRGCVETWLTCLFALAGVSAHAQEAADLAARGEQVFNRTCATGYCHGTKGIAAGAPRLVARGFDRAFIETTVTRGVSGTAMPAFAASLDRSDLTAVIAYVAGLNGIGMSSAVAPKDAAALSPEAARGRELFFDATRSFARCSTCHEVGGVGIPVATPFVKIPASIEELRSLATPEVRTAAVKGESMPVLVVSQGKRRTILYDLTSAPPVLRSEDPASIRIGEGSSWKHSALMGSYNDTELAAILTYLRAVR